MGLFVVNNALQKTGLPAQIVADLTGAGIALWRSSAPWLATRPSSAASWWTRQRGVAIGWRTRARVVVPVTLATLAFAAGYLAFRMRVAA